MASGRIEETWRSRYDRWAQKYEAEHLVAGWSEKGLSRRLALVMETFSRAKLPRGSVILDLGSGPGTYTRSIHALGYRCVGLDYSKNVLSLAKAKDPDGPYLQAEAYYLPFRKRAVDALLCVGVLQSLGSVHLALTEAQRVLKPGGYLLLDGLNSLFWLHVARGWKQSLGGNEKRMCYYDPFAVTGSLVTMGFEKPEIRWLAMPERFQDRLNHRRSPRLAVLPRLFGYAFLLTARKKPEAGPAGS